MKLISDTGLRLKMDIPNGLISGVGTTISPDNANRYTPKNFVLSA
jgi:hypothetical protein